MVHGMVHVSSFGKSCLIVISSDLSLSGSCWPLSNIGVSYSDSNALAYRSSSLILTSGSGFYSCDVTCTSGMGCLGVNRRSLMR